MLNDLLQWIVIGFVVLGCLGLYRQWGSALGQEMGDVASISGPRLQSQVPRILLDRLSAPMGGDFGNALFAFVTENCRTCEALIARLQRAPRKVASLPLVLVARRPSTTFLAALTELGVPIIEDSGEVFDKCNIMVTPFLVGILDGRVVFKEVGHDVEDAIEKVSAVRNKQVA